VFEGRPLTWRVGALGELSEAELRDVATLTAESWRAAYPFLPDHYLATLDADWWLNARRELYSGPGIGFVTLSADGALAGAAMIGPARPGACPGDGMITSLYLRADLIGSGLGHPLLERAEAALIDQGYPAISLDCWGDNHRAIDFYRGHGYSVVRDDLSWPAGGIEFPCVMLRKPV
jgi:ribosomal protein S18 acetylase RimI-like enzyme